MVNLGKSLPNFGRLLAMAGVLGFCLTSQGFAQNEPDPDVPLLQPIAMVNFASAERSLTDIGNMFEVSGRPDMMEMIQGVLGDKVGNLKGLDRTRPLGFMVFLEHDLPPRPRTMIYLPVENEDDLIATLRLGPVGITKTGDHTYEIENPGEKKKAPLLVENGYAYLLPNGDSFLEEQKIPNPADVAQRLTARYDVAVSVNLRGIPPLIKTVFANFFSQQTAAQMQQRDHESDASYQARKARGLSSLQWIEQLIRDGEEVTLGLDSTEDGRRAVLELNIDAVPESEFAKYLTGIAGAPTYFAPLLGEEHPLQISASWIVDQREKDALKGYVEAMRLGLRSQIPETAGPTVDRLTETLQATVEQGHIDGILQFLPQREQEFVLIGGLRVVGGETLGTSLRDVAAALAETNEEFEVDLDTHQFQNATLSRLHGTKANPGLARIYGGQPDLYFGVGGNVLWLGLGCGGTLPAIDAAIAATSKQAPAEINSSAPFSLVLRAVPWLNLPAQGGNRAAARRELMQTALQPEKDALKVEIRPTDTGGRVTFRFDEGFVRLLGLTLAQAYDRSQL
ncbi:hypothetical protein [Planctomicrobium piriforme]|uniref:DUF3352 domain-containing protein n=1 Tax=Planctomicrobium piriforme TaxID=1576369 RepID=A0A1I3EPF6_9PLAN|nr:hypothetical protein [Planctomicrobium piriforme]SFI00710.1 hypothetical protein SAMN05421753_104311 [Planctomicrobium piriforme]